MPEKNNVRCGSCNAGGDLLRIRVWLFTSCRTHLTTVMKSSIN